jgi:hypothetical protein
MDDWLYAKLNECNGFGSDVKLVLSFIFFDYFCIGDINLNNFLIKLVIYDKIYWR